ncbi:MAG TPA: HAMP domain-containing protein [Myxococcales bacterium]|nr:HAMP domain-containing protein [Myxococcales bacterium]
MNRKSPRFPISIKLILAAVILVAALTSTFGLLSTELLHDIYKERATHLSRERMVEFDERSKAVAGYISTTSQESLAGSETLRLTKVLSSIAKRDREIQFAIISDEAGRVLARSDMDAQITLSQNQTISGLDPSQLKVNKIVHNGRSTRQITYPIRPEEGSNLVLGYLRIAWSLENLDAELKRIAAQEVNDIERAATVLLIAGLAAIGVGMIAAFLGGLGLGQPIRKLALTARAISDGDLSARAEVTTQDEIGELATTMNSMVDRIEELLEETRIKAELEQELSVARGIQQALLPKTSLLKCPGIQLCGTVESASHCGGDWWAHYELTRSRTLVLVGDVTGHGISSALLTATARSCLDTVGQLTKNDFRVGYLLKILDHLLRKSVGDEFHMTCFAAIIDPLENTMTYANAGHTPPFLVRFTGDGWRHGWLAARGNRLGDADGYAFVEHTVATSEQDLICWYTDGLIETRREDDDQEFGTRRLRRTLGRIPHSSPDVILEAIMSDLNRFRGDLPLADDVTCIVGRIV